MSNFVTSNNGQTKEIDVILPKNQLNNLDFINKKLLEVSLDTLSEISKHSELDFIGLVIKLAPNICSVDNTFLSKWNITKEQLENYNNEFSVTTDSKKKKSDNELPNKEIKPTTELDTSKNSNTDDNIAIDTDNNSPKTQLDVPPKRKVIKVKKPRKANT